MMPHYELLDLFALAVDEIPVGLCSGSTLGSYKRLSSIEKNIISKGFILQR
jgi:hypothetical protein